MSAFRHRAGWLAMGLSVCLSGCVGTADYAYPRASGKVSRAATCCGVGTVSNGARLTLGGEWHQSGSFIVVAGDELILEQTVRPGDKVWVDIDHPLFGDCQVAVKVNGTVSETANTPLQVYRAYFLPDATGT